MNPKIADSYFDWLEQEQKTADSAEIYSLVLCVTIAELFNVFGVSEAEEILADIADAARCEHEDREIH